MMVSKETVDELRKLGWVELWQRDTDALERLGVPLRLAPCPPGESELWTATPMAPGWVVELIDDWNSLLNALDPWDVSAEILAIAIAALYRCPDPSASADAVLSALRLSGLDAARALINELEEARHASTAHP